MTDLPKIMFLLIIAIILASGTTVSANKEFLPPNYVFSTNYYDGFGSPDLYASVVGDPEFQRGDTVHLKINLVNKGVLYGVKYDTSVGTNPLLHAISLQELEYEMLRTTAIGIKAELVSDTPYIDVEPDTSIQTLGSLSPGQLPKNPLTFTITISRKAPAGVYYLQLPVSYQYQSQVRMTTNDVARLGLPGLDHIALFNNSNKTLEVPVYVQAAPSFEVAEVAGELVAGGTRTIDVTYRNIGEVAAEGALVRMVVMRPLQVKQPVVSIGTLGPGESKTVSFEITADPDAIAKTYGIDSELKYYDEDGEISFSDNLKVSVPLTAAEKKIGAGTIAFAGVVVLLIYLVIKSVKNAKDHE